MSHEHRIQRAHRCRCGEFPQAHHDVSNGQSWLACSVCGQIGESSADPARAIYSWNERNTEGGMPGWS